MACHSGIPFDALIAAVERKNSAQVTALAPSARATADALHARQHHSRELRMGPDKNSILTGASSLRLKAGIRLL